MIVAYFPACFWRPTIPSASLALILVVVRTAERTGHVITYLWMLKGEALVANSDKENARLHFQVAIKNAQATGEKFLIWCIHINLEKLFRTMGSNEAARKEFLLARAQFDELTSTITDETLKEKFRHGTCNILTQEISIKTV